MVKNVSSQQETRSKTILVQMFNWQFFWAIEKSTDKSLFIAINCVQRQAIYIERFRWDFCYTRHCSLLSRYFSAAERGNW